MSEFLASYGLWLLVALLIVVVVAWLLLGRKKADAPEPIQPPAPAPKAAPAPQPVAAAPVPEPGASPAPAPTPPTPAPAPPVVEAAASATDDLLLLKGVGPKLNTVLKDLGITRFAQIAAWTDADIAAIDPKLSNFQGRPVRDHWVDQAKYLAAGDIPGFEAKYGKI